jgi:hypothetical protein
MSERTAENAAPSNSDPALMRAAGNWQTAKAALCTRIRRRWTALARLNPGIAHAESVDLYLQTAGDDAVALFGLADQIDRRLDLAFATRACHTYPSGAGVRGRPAHDEFKTS